MITKRLKSRRKLWLKKLFSPIESKKRNLRHAANNLDFWFDHAVNPRIVEISKEIEDIEQKIQDLNEELTGETVDEHGDPYDNEYGHGRPSDHDLNIYDELGGLYYDTQMLEEQKLSIETMRLVYLYKSFEILLKDIVAEAFPRVNKRDLFQWENIKSFLNNNGIIFGEIKEYQHVNEIRIVNNNIKHSNIIDELTKKQNIPEFDRKDSFDYTSIASFYSRIKDKPNIFLNDLAEKLIGYLFEFDDERIHAIANEYKNRMDRVSGQKLIAALNKIFS
jgi:hypothetical protein